MYISMAARTLFSVAPGDPLPIYRQLVEQVKGALAAGVLGPDDRLPSHRELARDLHVAPLTVKRAYDVLDREGWIRTRRGRGTFVATRAAPNEEATADLDARLGAVVRQARALGLDEAETARRLATVWHARSHAEERR